MPVIHSFFIFSVCQKKKELAIQFFSVWHSITIWISNNRALFVFNKYHSVDTPRKCREHSLVIYKPVVKQSLLFQNSVLVSQNIILVSLVVMCFNIDQTSFVLLFLWINAIHWCTNRMCCYHWCSNKHSAQSWTMTKW